MSSHVGVRFISLITTIAFAVAAQSTLGAIQPIASGLAPGGPGPCQQDSDCTRWNYRCISSFDDQYLYTYDFTPDFKDLPSAFMPSSGKGCNLILRPSSGQKPNEQNLQEFQDMQAFPYCSHTQSQDNNQKQAEPKEVSEFGVKYEKETKGDSPWYVLEKLRGVDGDQVYGEALYRVEVDGTSSKIDPGNPKSLRFPNPYKNGVGAVEASFLKRWRGDDASRSIIPSATLQAIENELAHYFIYVDSTTRKSCQQ